jgi:hypothetical protein
MSVSFKTDYVGLAALAAERPSLRSRMNSVLATSSRTTPLRLKAAGCPHTRQNLAWYASRVSLSSLSRVN